MILVIPCMRVNAGGKFIAEWLSKRPPGLAFSSSAAVLSAHDLRGPLTFSSARKHGSPACHWAFAHSQGDALGHCEEIVPY